MSAKSLSTQGRLETLSFLWKVRFPAMDMVKHTMKLLHKGGGGGGGAAAGAATAASARGGDGDLNQDQQKCKELGRLVG